MSTAEVGISDAISRKMPPIFIDQRGGKCTGISWALPAEFRLEKQGETLELPQTGGYMRRRLPVRLRRLVRRSWCSDFRRFIGVHFRW
jgi:hypothetical protein